MSGRDASVAEDREVRRVAAVREDEPGDAAIGELADDAGERRRPGAVPGKRGEPLRPRIEPDRQPRAGDLEPLGERRRVVGDRHRRHDPRRAGREGEPDPVGACRRRPRPGSGSRSATAIDPTASRLPGPPGPRAVEVDEMDQPRAAVDEALGDPLRAIGRGADAGRRARPEDDPGAAAIEVDRGDDLHVRCGPPGSRRCPPFGSPPASLGRPAPAARGGAGDGS